MSPSRFRTFAFVYAESIRTPEEQSHSSFCTSTRDEALDSLMRCLSLIIHALMLRASNVSVAAFYHELAGGTRCFAHDPLVKIQEGFKFEES